MKHQKRILIILLAIVGVIFSFSDLSAQKKRLTYKQVFEGSGGMRGMMGMMGTSRAIGWVDDEHYIEVKYNQKEGGLRAESFKTNVKDGSSVPLVDNSKVQLPEGFSIDRPNLFSSDYNYYLFYSKKNILQSPYHN